jgi:hypothetical protein
MGNLVMGGRTKLVGLLATALVVAAAFVMRPTSAADHLDSEGPRADPAADIDDVYAWVPKAGRTAMIMTTGDTFIAPGSRFGTRIEYRFVIRNVASKDGQLAATASARDIVCIADDAAVQTITCTTSTGVSKSHALGASPACDETADEICVWAGPRKDPAYGDIKAFDRMLEGGLAELEGGTDALADSNVLAIVLDVDSAKVLGTKAFDPGPGGAMTETVAVAAETVRKP